MSGRIGRNAQSLRKNDEAWLVVDTDSWTDGQLDELCYWAQGRENHGIAISNPKFELWLLLHFENGHGVSTSQACTNRLKKHLPSYEKGISLRDFSKQSILDAKKRAKQKDTPPCKDWPRNTGTTVYRLIERILGES